MPSRITPIRWRQARWALPSRFRRSRRSRRICRGPLRRRLRRFPSRRLPSRRRPYNARRQPRPRLVSAIRTCVEAEMITRRDIALGGLLSIGWLAAPCGCPAHAASAPQRFGCELADDEVEAALTASVQAYGPGGTPKFVESGDRDLDYAMAQTLSLLTDTWNVLPAFAYYDDTGAPN